MRLSEGNDISFNHLPNGAGLSQTRAENIAQDHDGFMWFGTQSGLNRFDGYKCKVFKHDPEKPGSLSGVFVNSLFEDRSGALWVGSDQYLDRFDPATETFSPLHVSPTDLKRSTNFHFVSQDSAGMLWMPTDVGLYRLNPSNGQIQHYSHDPNNPATLSDTEAQSADEDRSGNFWVGTRAGLDQFDRASGNVRLHLLLDDSGLGLRIHEDRFGTFWIIYGDGILAVLDRQNNRLTRFSFEAVGGLSGTSSPVYPMLEDADGTMWFGTNGNGLLKYDRDHHRFISYNMRSDNSESLADTRVIALFQDREGNIWVGLHQSAPMFFSTKPPSFDKFVYRPGDPNNGLGSALVSVIHEDRQGVLWLGADRMLRELNRKTGHYSTFDQIRGHEVLSILEQGPDVLWFGTAGLGLKRYNRRTGALKTYLNIAGDRSSLCSNFIEKLLMDRKGRLWEASWGGLCYLDLTTDLFTPLPYDRAGLTYHAITEDHDGIIWLGSQSGLERLDPETRHSTVFKHTNATDSLSADRVNSVYVSDRGTLWLGTQNGLDRFDSQTGGFIHFNQRDGIAGSVVSCILEDWSHRLWMSTNSGVSSFDPVTRKFNNYSVADGLPGPDLTGWGACFKNDSGEMFFGGFSGATAFRPDKIGNGAYAPPIVLTEFRLFGDPVGLGRDSPLKRSITHTDLISLSRDRNIFSIEFSALSYSSAETNRFRYKLDGLQKQWAEVGSDRRFASYTTLPTGVYTFRVEGATSRGPWSAPGASVVIEIQPPWWNIWWVETFISVFVVILVWSSHRYRLHQITQQYNLRVEERINERTRIARELHDTLLQSFQGSLIQMQAARNLFSRRPEHAVQTLDEAVTMAEGAIAESRDAIQGLRSEPESQRDFADLLIAMGRDLARSYEATGSQVIFGMTVEGEREDLKPLVHDESYRIGRELLRNAFQHAQARHIKADIQYGDRLFRVCIRDDGKGIEPEILKAGGRPGHWGLLGMQERAQRIGALLNFRTAAGKGTEVELTIPSSVAYHRAIRRTRRFPLLRKKVNL